MSRNRAGTCDPRRTSIKFFGNYVEVNGEPRYPKPLENGTAQFEYNGLTFESETEVIVAQLLVQQGIRFLHHVRFPFRTPVGDAKVWSPDFLFDRPYLLLNPRCRLTHHWLIHGLEIKGTCFYPDVLLKQRQLVTDHNVHIHLLRYDEVIGFERCGSIQLEPYEPQVNEPVHPPITIIENGIVQCRTYR